MNVATFVLFRILLLGWMTRWLTLHRDDVPILFFTVGSLGLATIVGMNIVLFYRILVGDYIKSSTKKSNAAEDSDNSDSASNSNPDISKLQPSTQVHQRRKQAKLLSTDVNRIVRSLFEEQD